MSYYCEIKGVGFVYSIQDGRLLVSAPSYDRLPLRLPLRTWLQYEESGMFDDVPEYSFCNHISYYRT